MADVRFLATLSDDALAGALRELGPGLAAPSVTVNGVDAAFRSRVLIQWLQARERGETLPAPRLGPIREPRTTPRVGPLVEPRAAPRVGPLLQPRPSTRVGPRYQPEPSRRLRPARSSRSFRRSLVLAVAAVLVVAAIVGAVGLGLPGLRIITAPASPRGSEPPAAAGSPPPSSSGFASPSTSPTSSVSAAPGPPGSGLGLGVQTTLADARQRSSFPLLLPTDPRLGPPDTVWVDAVGRVTLVWARRTGFPDTIVPGVSVIVSEFPGSIDPGYFQKILGEGTTIEPVRVDQSSGYWIAGAPHDFIYVNPSGEPDFDSRRQAGDTLAWSMKGVTYKMETGLGEDSTVAIAAGMR
jgi:hypothetical protein